MTQGEVHPRHARPEEPRDRRPLVLGGTAVVTLLAVVGGVALARNGAEPRSSSSSSSSATSSASASSSPSCAGSAAVAVDPAWSKAVTSAAKAWSDSLGSFCPQIAVDEKASAVVARSGLGSDAAWIPEDTTWTARASSATLRAATPAKLGTSPLVVVNQPAAAAALGEPLQPATLGAMLTTRQTWANHGHAGWGTLKLVLPPVASTASGAAAAGSLTRLAAGGATGQAALGQAMAQVQQRVVAQVPVSQVPQNLASSTAGGAAAGPRTGVTTEAVALADGSVHASYLDGRTGLTMGLVNPSGNQNVKDFVAWLRTEDGQQALANGGVRAGSQVPSATQRAGAGLSGTATVDGLQASQLDATRQGFAAASRRAAALLVLDTSGSMANPLDRTSGMRKIDLVLRTALQGWTSWPSGMATGLITFNASNDKAETPQIRTVVPMTRTDSATWAQTAPQYQQALQRLQVTGGTPLYQAIEYSWDYMQLHHVAGMPNKIVVITDGSSQDAAGEPTLAQLVQRLPKASQAKQPVQVIYVALGAKADFATLQKIASATGQTAVRITSMAELQTKLPLLFQG